MRGSRGTESPARSRYRRRCSNLMRETSPVAVLAAARTAPSARPGPSSPGGRPGRFDTHEGVCLRARAGGRLGSIVISRMTDRQVPGGPSRIAVAGKDLVDQAELPEVRKRAPAATE